MKLGAIAGATITVPDLDAACTAYDAYLGYRGERGQVDKALAARLGAPKAVGARLALLRPQSGEAQFIRIIEAPGVPNYRPLTGFGWNAIEIIVQDLTKLADQLKGSPFKIIGPPRVLDFDFTDKISAMQVAGPGGEVLYFTEVSGDVPGFTLPKALSFVGRIFVMILGVADIARTAAVFKNKFDKDCGPEFLARIEVLSSAQDLPISTRHRLTTLALDDNGLIEIDAFPKTTTARRTDSLGLPSGIIMASFHGAPAGPSGDGLISADLPGFMEFLP
jgi:hypothetical protein